MVGEYEAAMGSRTSSTTTWAPAPAWRCTAVVPVCPVHHLTRGSDRTARRPRHCPETSTAMGAATSWCQEMATRGNGCAWERVLRIRIRRQGSPTSRLPAARLSSMSTATDWTTSSSSGIPALRSRGAGNLTTGGTASFAAEAVLWTASQGMRIAAQPFITASQRFRSTERTADFNGDGRGDLLLRVQVDGCGGNWRLHAQLDGPAAGVRVARHVPRPAGRARERRGSAARRLQFRRPDGHRLGEVKHILAAASRHRPARHHGRRFRGSVRRRRACAPDRCKADGRGLGRRRPLGPAGSWHLGVARLPLAGDDARDLSIRQAWPPSER